MKNFYVLCALTVIAVLCTGCGSTKVNCKCDICRDANSFICYAHDWGTPQFDKAYNDLTLDLIIYLETHEANGDLNEAVCDLWYEHPSFKKAIEDGFDGLCGDVYTHHTAVIDKFYNTLEIIDRH